MDKHPTNTTLTASRGNQKIRYFAIEYKDWLAIIHRSVFAKLVLISLIPGILASCSFKPKPSTILQDTSCSPPCWQQIKPGKTTKQETVSILSALPEIDRDSIRFVDKDNIYWESNTIVGDYGGRITFVNENVSVINFLHNKGALSVEEVVNKFGNPDKILAQYWESEISWLTVYLFYPREGFTFVFTNHPFLRRDQARITPDQTLDSTWYFDPLLFETIITSGPIDRLRPGVLVRDLQPWTGYGEITYTEGFQK